MTPEITKHRPGVLDGLDWIMDQSRRHLDKVNEWAPDLRSRLRDFASRGKLIRGSLVAIGAEIYGTQPGNDIYRVAAAMELIQSFLLIHDDIMDEDRLRRGKPAVFEQYRRLGEGEGYRNPDRFGESMGICAGDVGMLLAFEGIACTGLEGTVQRDLMCMLSREIADVGVAQMGDVAHGHTTQAAPESHILAVYRYKTGRYTFSLPLSLGARIAGAPPEEIELLADWGELQGVIFQIRDDQLGLMEADEDTGKPAGSDIIADKQTLHKLLLAERASGTQWEDVLALFGKETLSPDEVLRVRQALEALSVPAAIESRIEAMYEEAAAILRKLAAPPENGRNLLTALAEYNVSRRR